RRSLTDSLRFRGSGLSAMAYPCYRGLYVSLLPFGLHLAGQVWIAVTNAGHLSFGAIELFIGKLAGFIATPCLLCDRGENHWPTAALEVRGKKARLTTPDFGRSLMVMSDGLAMIQCAIGMQSHIEKRDSE